MFRKNRKQLKEYVFDSRKMNFVVERIMNEYLLRGRIEDHNDSFLIVCDKDKAGNLISVDSTLEQLGRIAHQNEGDNPDGITFDSFSDSYDLLHRSQWFARINYREPITIISDNETIEYRLRLSHQESLFNIDCLINHYPDSYGIFSGGPFQADKIVQDKILISEVDSQRLDEMIRNIYDGRISETYR